MAGGGNSGGLDAKLHLAARVTGDSRDATRSLVCRVVKLRKREKTQFCAQGHRKIGTVHTGDSWRKRS